MKSLRERIMGRISAMRGDRSSFEAHWRDIGNYLLPRRGQWFGEGSATNTKQQGIKKSQKIINSSGLIASRTLASGMMAGLTSPARPWFRLTVADQSLAERADVRTWLDDVGDRMRDVLERSNFYSVLPSVYRELGVFGTSVFSCMPDQIEVVRFYQHTVGSCFIAQNHRLQVDSFGREFSMTVAQVYEKYGENACSDELCRKYSAGKYDETVQLVQVIQPNRELEIGKADRSGMPFESVVMESSGIDPDKALDRKGFHEYPIFALRWETMPETPYGINCPGMEALGDVKQLQFLEVEKAKTLERHNTPALQGSGIQGAVSLLPGAITITAPVQGKEANVSAIHIPDPRAFQFSAQEINVVERRINAVFFADLFLMLANDDRATPPTAEEIRARQGEKMLVLGPVLEQCNTDGFDPLIDCVFGQMSRRGMIPPAPQALQGAPMKVEYTSVMAQAQRMTGTENIERFARFAGELAAQKQSMEPWDKIDTDQMMDDYGHALGVPAKQMVSEDAVTSLRDQRNKQKQMQQAAAMAKPFADAAQGAKSLGEVQANPNIANALQQAMSAQGMPQQ